LRASYASFDMEERNGTPAPRSNSRQGDECVKANRTAAGAAFDAVDMQSLLLHKAFHSACWLGSRW